ncbi:MAG TPA: bifunctional phosphopantothenoylcysteine decarboxylase/phosphopantothenate--cysteine ligase CoaBC [Polyangiaceae bacterium]|nr:bifunctional phosphopantothenoylcysteine decarboxylase/phosphopantothenate--cysteine ligase CoaBC [Polyangiaceae bacterium]
MNEPNKDRVRRPTVALCVTGSIAAFKAVEIVRALVTRGVRVLPVLTRSGAKFVGRATFTGLCAEPAREDMWDPSFPGELHIHLATEADVVVVAPATADVIARMVQGRADDLVTALLLCSRAPIVVAPAMHPRMFAHPATQRNVRQLREDGRATIVGPVVGPVANGEVGLGRMADPVEIAAAALSLLGPRDLAGRRLLVTAGPTVEDIDPVRFVGNRSSGRMGFAIAQRAALRGAKVTLVAGPVELPTPPGVERVDVRSALQMQAAMHGVLGADGSGADAVVMAAAVADYRPAHASTTKHKRGAERISLELEPNPDLIAQLGASRAGRRPVLVGFALETAQGDDLVRLAREKLERKRVDLVVANAAQESIGLATNRAALVTPTGEDRLGELDKGELADRILDRVRDLLAEA